MHFCVVQIPLYIVHLPIFLNSHYQNKSIKSYGFFVYEQTFKQTIDLNMFHVLLKYIYNVCSLLWALFNGKEETEQNTELLLSLSNYLYREVAWYKKWNLAEKVCTYGVHNFDHMGNVYWYLFMDCQ